MQRLDTSLFNSHDATEIIDNYTLLQVILVVTTVTVDKCLYIQYSVMYTPTQMIKEVVYTYK